ncbi:hypothetical protein [Novosphingobium album (ex Liu et al. 2023)]|uniref:Phasin family protein n=1 Tax=Novosphingobium album (ex Liu et al. 2023) TaxID=3031130 RepID=A0ABT5WKR3_9SPHN|nr:hypothetical protein [Novosphingobium album (ex Liu et al. 2023)]MDE8650631.1 hypothetical protein [Novosphingobium album (ex Liu et al. 2023)]
MTFPFEHAVAIAGANRQLAAKCFEIARTTGARQVAIGTQALGSFFEPGKFPEVVQEAAQNRQVFIDDTKAAFEEWRENAGDLFSPGRDTLQLVAVFEPLRAFFLAPLETVANSFATAARVPAADTAGSKT